MLYRVVLCGRPNQRLHARTLRSESAIFVRLSHIIYNIYKNNYDGEYLSLQVDPHAYHMRTAVGAAAENPRQTQTHMIKCAEMDKLICLVKVKATSSCTINSHLSKWFDSFSRFLWSQRLVQTHLPMPEIRRTVMNVVAPCNWIL